MRTRALWIILICSLAIRVALLGSAWNAPHRLMTPDSEDYIELSRALVEKTSFARDGRAEIFRTPGYPLFLVIGAGFGESWWRAVAIVQIVLDVLLVYLTFLLGTLLCDRPLGLWAAAFQAITGVSIASGLRILSDGLFAFTLTLTILLLMHHFKTGRWWSLLGAAVLAGWGCYVRPIGLAFCMVTLIVLLARMLTARGDILRPVAFAGVVVAIITPWIVRNRVVGDYTAFSSFAGDSLYFFAAPKVLGRVRNIDPAEIRREMRQQDALRERSGEGERFPGQGARDRAGQARRIIQDYPGLYARIHLLGSGVVFLPGVTDILEILGVTTGQRGTLDTLHGEGLRAGVKHYLGENSWALWVCVPAAILLGLKYVLVVVCAGWRARWRMGAGGWLILLTVVVFALSGGPAATPRFRVPLAPLLSVGAGGGIVLLTDWFKRRRAYPR